MSGSYNAGSIEASLRLDRSEFNRELGQAKRDAEEFQKQKYTPKVSLDDTEAKAKLAALKQELQNLHNVSVNAALSGFDGVAAQLATLKATVDELNGSNIVIHADIDTRAATASLAALRLAAADPITVRTDLDTSTAAASLAALRAAAADPITIRTRTDGGGGRPRVPTPGDDDDTGSRKLKDPFKLPEGSLSALFSLPGLIAAVSPQIPALTTFVGGLTASVASFGVAAAGSFGTFGVATMGAVKAAVAHKKAVDQTEKALEQAQIQLAGTTAGTDAYDKALQKVTQAEEAHKKALQELTPVEKEFNNSIGQVQGAWQKFIGATEQYTLKPVVTVIQGATAALPKFIPLVKDLAPLVQGVADSLKKWMSGGGLTEFVNFLRTYGVPIVKNMILGLKGFLTAGGDLVRAFGPMAVQMSGWFKELGDRVARWADSGGAERFRVKFTQSWHQLKPIFLGLIDLVKHVWDLLSGTGQPNADALSGIIGDIASAVGSIKPAAVKAFGEIFQSLSDVAVALAPMIGITSKAIVDIVNALPPGTIRAIADAMIAWKIAVLGWNAAIAVWGFLAGLIEGVSTAWAILNFVWYASPITVIIGIGVVVVGVILLIATKTTWFQQLWQTVWGAIKDFALHAWNDWLKPIFHGIAGGLEAVGKWAQKMWTDYIKPAWDALVGGAESLWKNHLKPIFHAIGSGFETLGKILWKIYWGFVGSMIVIMAAAFKALWLFVLKPLFGLILLGWQGLVTGMKWAWSHILKPAWDHVEEAAVWLWKHALKPVFGWIEDGWNGLLSGMKWAWTHILKPAWDAVAGAAESLWKNHLKPVFNGIGDFFSSFWSGVKRDVFSPMGTLFTKTIPGWGSTMKDHLVGAFKAAKEGLGEVWDGVKKTIGSPIYLVARYVWNDAIYWVMDKLSSFVHMKNPLGKINTDKIPHFAAGGPVPHTAGSTPGRDSVHAMLMPDEHVLTREDVAAMGGQQAVMRFRSALHGGAPVQGANDSGNFGLGGFFDSVGSGLKKVANKTVGALENAALGALGVVVDPMLNTAERAINKFIPDDGGFDSLANHGMKQPIEWIKGFIHKQDKKAQSVGGVIPTGQHLAIIDAALKAAGVPPPGTKEQWEAGLNTLITRESGWNPNAINRTDSNAKAGHPSQGLAQTIPSTFQAYVPSSLRGRSITDPVANVAAAIRYIVAVYGNISNVQQANAHKAPKGYWTGTSGAAPGLAWVGERGPELVRFHGGETVYNNRDSMQMLRDGILGGLGGYASGTSRHRTWEKQLGHVRHDFSELDRDTKARDAAQKKYDEAHKAYLNATSYAEQKKAKAEMAKYAQATARLNREIKNDNTLLNLDKKRYQSAYNHVSQERKDADTLANARKKARDAERQHIQDWINTQKAKIDAKIQTATDARNNYYDTAVQTGQLSSLTGNRAAGFAQQIQNKIKAIKDFQKNLHTLATLGLSQALIQQIAAMGPEQGGALAQSLARTTTKADAANLNKQYSELEKVSSKYADSAADDAYGLSQLKRESNVLAHTSVTVKAPHTIILKVDGHTMRAYTEKVAEEKLTTVVARAGKKK